MVVWLAKTVRLAVTPTSVTVDGDRAFVLRIAEHKAEAVAHWLK